MTPRDVRFGRPNAYAMVRVVDLWTDHASEFGGSHMHHIFITVVGRKFYLTFTDPGATGSGFGERIREFLE